MKKKILIICNHFAPDNTIAAVRISKLAKYLKKSDYDIEVIAERKTDIVQDEILKRDTSGINVQYAYNSHNVLKILEKYKKIIEPIRNKRFNNMDNRYRTNQKTGKKEFYTFQAAYPLISSLDYIADLLRQFDLFLSVKKTLRNYENVDYLITSYGDFFGIFAGKYYHKKHKKSIWVFDIRDAICRYKFTPRYVSWIAHIYERYLWRNTDCITAVSKGICRGIPKKYWGKVHCVTNGFDKTDRDGLETQKKENQDKMVFTYTGSMYGGLRDLSNFFYCIRLLIDEEKIEEEKVLFKFAGTESAYNVFQGQANKFNLKNRCNYYGNIPRKEALQLQIQSDVLIVASYDYQLNEGGVITGKALEYMSANRPIIALITGDVEHSELALIVREANLGVAYEESHKGEDLEKLKQFILNNYRDFERCGHLIHTPNYEVMKKYDYKYISRKFIKIIETLST